MPLTMLKVKNKGLFEKPGVNLHHAASQERKRTVGSRIGVRVSHIGGGNLVLKRRIRGERIQKQKMKNGKKKRAKKRIRQKLWDTRFYMDTQQCEYSILLVTGHIWLYLRYFKSHLVILKLFQVTFGCI